MNRDELYAFWRFEEDFPFSGWSFYHLDERWEEEPLPWDFRTEVLHTLRHSDMLLDVDTGDEFLLSLGHPYERTAVTEFPNPDGGSIANQLAPLGIRVASCDASCDELPFDDNTFDVVICRHGSYVRRELYRVLKSGGIVMMQQIGGRNNELLARRLLPGHEMPYPQHHLSAEVARFKQTGFEVLDAREYFPKLRFFDSGAVVYYAKIMDWEFPGFSVDACREELYALEKEIAERGFVQSMQHRFFLVARKPY